MQKNTLKNLNVGLYESHPFHLVHPSPWPLVTSGAVFALVIGLVVGFNWFESVIFFSFTIAKFCFALYRWFLDVTIEATFEGQHTAKVQSNIIFGMQWFIVSEIMFFFSFFWGYFHLGLVPSINTGAYWPTSVIEPWGIPFANTGLLISSGMMVTASYMALESGEYKLCKKYLFEAIILGILFTGLQVFEYGALEFYISSSPFGSVFYILTGFHGLHVLVGTIFLVVCYFRMIENHFSEKYYIGYTCAIWYWHFVDAVWVALFWIVYVWGRYSDFEDFFLHDFCHFINFCFLLSQQDYFVGYAKSPIFWLVLSIILWQSYLLEYLLWLYIQYVALFPIESVLNLEIFKCA